MPLIWRNITSGSRVMLPVYLGTYLLLGLEFALQAPTRTSTPPFEPAKWLMQGLEQPMHGWAAVFLAIAALEAVSLLLHRRTWEIVALALGFGMAAFWTSLLFYAARQDDRVSYTSGTWLLIVIAAHFASMLTLARRERGSA